MISDMDIRMKAAELSALVAYPAAVQDRDRSAQRAGQAGGDQNGV